MARRRSRANRRRSARRPRRRQRINLVRVVTPSTRPRQFGKFRNWLTRTFVCAPFTGQSTVSNDVKSWIERISWWATLGLKIITVVLNALQKERNPSKFDIAPIGAIGFYPIGIADLLASPDSPITVSSDYKTVYTNFSRGRLLKAQVQVSTETDVGVTGGYVTAALLPVDYDTGHDRLDGSIAPYKNYDTMTLNQDPRSVRKRFGQTINLTWRPERSDFLARMYENFGSSEVDGVPYNPLPRFVLGLGIQDLAMNTPGAADLAPSHAVMTVTVSMLVELEFQSDHKTVAATIFNSKPKDTLMILGNYKTNVSSTLVSYEKEKASCSIPFLPAGPLKDKVLEMYKAPQSSVEAAAVRSEGEDWDMINPPVNSDK